MLELPQINIDAPIAGQSLTAELGGRPWQQPPQYSTVEEALDYYVGRLTHPDMQEELMSTIELGAPLTVVANAIQAAGVMEGKHTLDVGMLSIPVLVEVMRYLAEEQDIKYEIGTNKTLEDIKPSKATIALALQKVRESEGEEDIMEEEELIISNMPEEVEEPQGGLMSRRVQ